MVHPRLLAAAFGRGWRRCVRGRLGHPRGQRRPDAVQLLAARPGRPDPGAGVRRHAPRLHPERRSDRDRRGQGLPRGAQPGDRRHRGRALLQAHRRRLRGHHPRRVPERDLRQHAGRLDAHDAVGAQPVHAGRHALRRRGLQAQDPRGTPGPGARGGALQGVGARQVPQHGPLRHLRRPDGDRRRRGRPPVLRQERQGPDAARGRDARRHAAGAVAVLAGGQPRGHDPAPQRGPGQDGRARLHHAPEGAVRDEEGPRAQHGQVLLAGPRALRARLRQVRADPGVRPGRHAARRLHGHDDDQPQVPAARARRDEPARRCRPVLGDRHDRPQERRHPDDGVHADVRALEGQVHVQPRHAGQASARLGLQDDGAAHRAARGCEPQLDARTRPSRR